MQAHRITKAFKRALVDCIPAVLRAIIDSTASEHDDCLRSLAQRRVGHRQRLNGAFKRVQKKVTRHGQTEDEQHYHTTPQESGPEIAPPRLQQETDYGEDNDDSRWRQQRAYRLRNNQHSKRAASL